MCAPCPRTDATYSWNWYGQFSYPQWCQGFSWKHGMGNLLYISHGTSSLTRCSHFLDETCSSTFCLWLIGAKLGRQSLTDRGNQRKNAKRIDYDYKVGDKILRYKKVSSAKQSPTTAKSHGQSQQFIWMELSGFNAEPELNNLVSGE